VQLGIYQGGEPIQGGLITITPGDE